MVDRKIGEEAKALGMIVDQLRVVFIAIPDSADRAHVRRIKPIPACIDRR